MHKVVMILHIAEDKRTYGVVWGDQVYRLSGRLQNDSKVITQASLHFNDRIVLTEELKQRTLGILVPIANSFLTLSQLTPKDLE